MKNYHIVGVVNFVNNPGAYSIRHLELFPAGTAIFNQYKRIYEINAAIHFPIDNVTRPPSIEAAIKIGSYSSPYAQSILNETAALPAINTNFLGFIQDDFSATKSIISRTFSLSGIPLAYIDPYTQVYFDCLLLNKDLDMPLNHIATIYFWMRYIS